MQPKICTVFKKQPLCCRADAIYYLVRHFPILIAPCGLRGCKNRPAPFSGRMPYKATKVTKPGYFRFISYHVLLCCCLLWPLLCIASFRWYVFCLLVVLVKFQYLPSDWLERLPWGSQTVARGSSPKSLGRRVHMIFLVYSIVSLFNCMVVLFPCSTWYTLYFYGMI